MQEDIEGGDRQYNPHLSNRAVQQNGVSSRPAKYLPLTVLQLQIQASARPSADFLFQTNQLFRYSCYRRLLPGQLLVPGSPFASSLLFPASVGNVLMSVVLCWPPCLQVMEACATRPTNASGTIHSEIVLFFRAFATALPALPSKELFPAAVSLVLSVLPFSAILGYWLDMFKND